MSFPPDSIDADPRRWCMNPLDVPERLFDDPRRNEEASHVVLLIKKRDPPNDHET